MTKIFKFHDLFFENDIGQLLPKRTVRFGPATMTPAVTFDPGFSFNGIELYRYKGCDLEAREENDVVVIESILKDPLKIY